MQARKMFRGQFFFACYTAAALTCLLFIYWRFSDHSTFLFISFHKYPYFHVFDQLQWISEFAGNKVRLLYSADCSERPLPGDIHNLNNGDVAVFSEAFEAKIAYDLKVHGVWTVFESAESPVHMRKLSNSEANLVDIFITYMPWSEVPFMYPMFLRNQNPEEGFTDDEIIAMLAKDNTHLLPGYHYERTRLVAWMVSNGRPKNFREAFAHGLQKYVSVDIYGAQGKVTPPGRDPFQWMSEHYKFYLAFENSNCNYYITEKATSNAMRYGMVPIVMGARKMDYMSVLPPHSYINVDDFKTFLELSKYLLYLDKNHTAYAEFFAWTEHGRIYIEKRLDCRLCGFVHQLNAGLVQLKQQSWQDFMDSDKLCFNRDLLPLGDQHAHIRSLSVDPFN